ncbi:MAG: putative Ig domain-containing protein, partial [Terracidiphilus sp.]
VQGVAITPVSLTGSGGAGGSYTYSATGLPPGLTMSSSGVISGTPTASGTYNYTVTITDTGGMQGSGRCSHQGTLNCTITVTPGVSASCLTIDAVQGDAIVAATLVGSGGSGGPYTFTATGLPAGLTLSSSGTISGTPTVSGTFNYTVTITDSKGDKGTLNCSITVLPPVTTSCVTFTAVQGVAITPVSLTGSGGAGGSYTYSATGLPPGLTMSSSGVISGTPTASGTYNYTVTITDTGGMQGGGRCSHQGTLNCTITVTPGVSATCLTIDAVQGDAIVAATLTASGGSGTGYTFTATGLPAGLTISSTGTISGTPTVSGTFNYTVTITDSKGDKGTLNCSITVLPPVTTSCVTFTAVQGVAITPVSLTGSGGAGGSYTYSASGLPPGLTMSSSGVISGTPTASGTYNYTVTITDTGGMQGGGRCSHQGTLNCTITVTPGVSASCLTIDAVQGDAIVAATLTASGGSGTGYTFTATGLPAGLTISSTGTISGTPTVSGTFSYTVTITDSKGEKGTLNCSITVLPPVTTGCVTFTAVQGVAITPVTLTGSGGAGGSYTYSATGLPPGLTMSSSGVISGTPTSSGTYNYTVTITDTGGMQGSGRCSHKGTLNCTITVTPGVVASCVSINATQGYAITATTLTASGGSGSGYTFTATGLPAGLSISSSGTISGTPTANGTFNYTVTITDSKGNKGTLNCSITVAPPTTCQSCVTINAQQGVAITPVTLAGSGGSGSGYTFTATGLPPGLSISSSGTISGTPTSTGTYNYTVTVKDSAGHTGTLNCSVTVVPPVGGSARCADGQKGHSINPITVSGSGGSGGSYTFKCASLPPGLSISTGGVISGTPTSSGNYNYTITVTDCNGHSGTVNGMSNISN